MITLPNSLNLGTCTALCPAGGRETGRSQIWGLNIENASGEGSKAGGKLHPLCTGLFQNEIGTYKLAHNNVMRTDPVCSCISIYLLPKPGFSSARTVFYIFLSLSLPFYPVLNFPPLRQQNVGKVAHQRCHLISSLIGSKEEMGSTRREIKISNNSRDGLEGHAKNLCQKAKRQNKAKSIKWRFAFWARLIVVINSWVLQKSTAAVQRSCFLGYDNALRMNSCHIVDVKIDWSESGFEDLDAVSDFELKNAEWQ